MCLSSNRIKISNRKNAPFQSVSYRHSKEHRLIVTSTSFVSSGSTHSCGGGVVGSGSATGGVDNLLGKGDFRIV